MNVLAIIPAKGRSRGIPMKNLSRLNKKPLLYYSINSALKSKLVTRTIVSTDNEKIANYAKQKTEVIMRPKRLATNTISIEHTIQHVLEKLRKKENYMPDIIILLEPTSPLRTHKHIDEAINFFVKKEYDSLLSGYLAQKLIWKQKKRQLVYPFNYDPKNRLNREDIKNLFIENGAIYMTKYSQFKKNQVRISGKIGIYKMPEESSIDIDTKFDLFIAEKILESNL